MNMHPSHVQSSPDRDDAQDALDTLRTWAMSATPEEVADLDPAVARLLPGQEVSNYPALARAYPEEFEVDDAYRATMPDLQNGPTSLIRGARQQLQHVGISNFRLPVRFHRRDESDLTLESSVTGTVSLEAGKKGINMSRIMRSFYDFKDDAFTMDKLESVLNTYQDRLDAFDSKVALKFSYPIMKPSLRSANEGYQYYNVTLEGDLDKTGTLKKIIHFDFVYSSACPCSYELSEHARKHRGKSAVPHSQRSVARISVEVDDIVWVSVFKAASQISCKSSIQTMSSTSTE
ncbi:GTP cyclohydrolase I FolE2, partial [Roseovarius sp.]|uniref:GTP cyclohydrolase I FolE2 n=1 Tax=Roseovarius sp. TaxID=1486281 RepID=UPI0035188555